MRNKKASTINCWRPLVKRIHIFLLLVCFSAIYLSSSGHDAKQHQKFSSRSQMFVAIIVCTKSTGVWKSANDSSLKSILLPSVTRTLTRDEKNRFRTEVLVAYDSSDLFWGAVKNRKAVISSNHVTVNFVAVHKVKNRIPFNEIAELAFVYGAEYIVRVNDDTEFMSVGWISAGMKVLKNLNPPNTGVVGPVCHPSPQGILTHDMVHNTHLRIFDTYYPPAFDNWWVDDWITAVYGHRMKQLKEWKVRHHVNAHGTRYEHNDSQKLQLQTLIEMGKQKIVSYVANEPREISQICRLRRSQIEMKNGPVVNFWRHFKSQCDS